MSNKKNSDNKSNKKQNTKNMKINEWPRHGIQALWAFITNSHVTGFVTGKIYTGKLKNACVPGLNCYSCPGAVGACPIGSLQAVIGSWNFKMAYYVVGFLIFIGAMVGRLICGILRPNGQKQEQQKKKPELANWQKVMDNGEYLRSAEMAEEANYNMIDGLMNNMPKKKDKNAPRRSVLKRLRKHQQKIASQGRDNHSNRRQWKKRWKGRRSNFSWRPVNMAGFLFELLYKIENL